MLLTAETTNIPLIFEWTVNGVVIPESTQTINIDVTEADNVSARMLNECGNWSLPFTLVWDGDDGNGEEEKGHGILFILIIAIIIIMIMKVK